MGDSARTATVAALRVRRDLGLPVDYPVCVYDMAESLAVDVRFVKASSLEGLYRPGKRAQILLGSERPSGRQHFTCAHEVGHHVLKHGTRVDELLQKAQTRAPEEDLADAFASELLMPKLAVAAALSSRHWKPSDLTAERVYMLAKELGVGHATLAKRLHWGLKLVTREASDSFAGARQPEIRERLLGFRPPADLVVVDDAWRNPCLDLTVGDLALFNSVSTLDCPSCSCVNVNSDRMLKAVAPGVCSIGIGSKTIRLRVSRRGFEGLAVYRHLADESDGT